MKKTLIGGLVAVITESRKSAIPEGIPGKHMIVCIEDAAGKQVNLGEATLEQEGEAQRFFLQEMWKISQDLGKPGCFRMCQNGPGIASRPTWHFHGIALGLDLAELAAKGLEPARLVDPTCFLVPIKEEKAAAPTK